MERRGADRFDAIMIVKIEFGLMSIEATILDVSSTGIRTYLLHVSEIPEVVTVRLPDELAYVACCRWHRNDEAGFEFLPTAARRLLKTSTGYSKSSILSHR